MSRRVARVIAAASMVVAATVPALGVTAGSAAASETKTFIGYGYLPSDAYNDAVRQMDAYSSTCTEVSTTYSSAGSMHYWKATLTAIC